MSDVSVEIDRVDGCEAHPVSWRSQLSVGSEPRTNTGTASSPPRAEHDGMAAPDLFLEDTEIAETEIKVVGKSGQISLG